jgi:hypothetical protein
VALPGFNEEGDLPPGVHRATLAEVLQRFGSGSVQRRAVGDRLNRLYQLASLAGQLARFVVFGSFVTAKDEPNDVDIVLLMEDTFDLAARRARPSSCSSTWRRLLTSVRACFGHAGQGRLAESRR